MPSLDFTITPRQRAFIDAQASEVLYGGAAGGGKSYGQFIDTVIYAGRYPESRQIIFRRTLPELEQSIIGLFQKNLPKELFTYNGSKHLGRFKNGSVVYFGYIDKESDVHRYQGAEYDVIRYDELTHFTEKMYVYLLSRLRGTTPYPRAMKSSTNPGNIGHTWVKARFIDPAPPNTEFIGSDGGSRIFLPAKVQDNCFLMENDPGYLRRLEQMDEREKRALLFGEWDLFDGMFFGNFDRAVHVIPPLFGADEIPNDWEFYISIDYGLDMLAALLIGVAPGNRFYVVREHYESGLIVSEAAAAIKELKKGYEIKKIFAPPDLWGRSKDTGKSIAEVFRENGVQLFRVDNNRVSGWMVLKEMLKPCADEQGATVAQLRIFEGCRNLIRTLPAVGVDDRNPNDVAREPHELTHAPDALRYFFAGRPAGKRPPEKKPRRDFGSQKPKESPGREKVRIV
jgi:hypothetical protein